MFNVDGGNEKIYQRGNELKCAGRKTVLATVVPPSHQVCCLKTKQALHTALISVVQRNEFHWAVKGILYSLAFPEPVNSEEINTYTMIYTIHTVAVHGVVVV